MPLYLAVPCLLLGTVLQVTVLPYASGAALNVDLVLLLVMAWGIINGVQEGLLWGLIGGLFLDVVTAAPFGTNMVLLGLIGAGSGTRSLTLLRGTVLVPVVAAAIATISYDGLTMGLLSAMGREWRWLDMVSSTVFPSALVNALAMAPVYGLFSWLNRRRKPEIKW